MGIKDMTRLYVITREEDGFVATDFATGVASQGLTADEARSNLAEALSLYYEGSNIDYIPDIYSAELVQA